jgi:tetratricopeptide (TPR) repeat protein
VKVPKIAERRPRRLAVLAVLAALSAMGVWGIRLWTDAGADPDSIWKEAQSDFRQGRYGRTDAALARLARLRTPTPLDRLMKAQLALARNRDEEALSNLAGVPDSHPMAAQARLLAGQLNRQRLRLRAAESFLLEAVRLDPKLIQAHRELIYIYGMQLRRPELSAEFRALSRLTALTYDDVFRWCLTRNSVWEPKESARDLRSYLEADPDDRPSRLALAENLRQIGKREEADKVLDPLGDSDPEARAIRVRIALDRGDDRGAEALLAGGPENHSELSRMRGRLALAHRDGPAAVKHFRAAYGLEPDNRDTIFGLGQALAMVGDATAAAPFIAAARDYDAYGTLLQRAATIYTNRKSTKDPDLMRALGASCEKIHRIPEARAWYGLAIEANPLDTEAQRALFRLKDEDGSADRPAGARRTG